VNARKVVGSITSPVAVVGLGNWGTALAQHIARKGFEVVAWSANNFIVESIKAVRVNPSYLSEIPLHANIKPTNSFEDVRHCRCIILAVPSVALPVVVKELEGISRFTLIVSGVKGIDSSTFLTPLHFVEASYPAVHHLATISGPCFAADLISGKPSALVAAAYESEVADVVSGLFSTSFLRVYSSTDPIGVEIGGITKNIIACAAGVCDVLGLGDSAQAALITRGLAEITRFAVALGAQSSTLSGLSGLGDLLMTATSDKSRNRRLGKNLGQGMSLSQAIAEVGSVAEVVHVCPLIKKLSTELGVSMPITEQVDKLLVGDITPDQMVHELLSRPLTSEF
jgi:glycerol-3-phosphate dehydrogenase (NAD(P)+)